MSKPKRCNDINLLHWKARKYILKAKENANMLIKKDSRCNGKDIEIRLFETVRSDELQTYYFENGWAPYGIPTFHKIGVGLASDGVVYVGGQPTWDDEYLWVYNLWGQESKKVGLTWGGNWKSRDLPHVQLDGGLSSQNIRDGKRPSWFFDKEPGDHYAELDYQYLTKDPIGIKIHDKRFDDPITRGEVIVLLARVVKWVMANFLNI